MLHRSFVQGFVVIVILFNLDTEKFFSCKSFLRYFPLGRIFFFFLFQFRKMWQRIWVKRIFAASNRIFLSTLPRKTAEKFALNCVFVVDQQGRMFLRCLLNEVELNEKRGNEISKKNTK